MGVGESGFVGGSIGTYDIRRAALGITLAGTGRKKTPRIMIAEGLGKWVVHSKGFEPLTS